MAITKNKGSGVLLLGLLVLAVAIYHVPGLKDLFFGLPLLVELGIIMAVIFGIAALNGHWKRRNEDSREKRQRERG